jgi:TetR/AcrR family transcriptional regulator, cholesterol catabolism regulator
MIDRRRKPDAGAVTETAGGGVAAAPLTFRDEVAVLKRQRILDAAADLFYRQGYSNTTLDAVAEQLGFTKAFIYANFSSKPEVLAAICERGVSATQQAVGEALDMGLDTRATLRLLIDRYVTTVLAHQKDIALYTREEKSLAPEDALRIGQSRRRFFMTIARFIERGRDEGVFVAPDPLMSALTLGGSVTWTVFWYRENGRLDRRQVAREITRAAMLTLGAERPG